MKRRSSKKKPVVKKGISAFFPFSILWGTVKVLAALGGAKIKK